MYGDDLHGVIKLTWSSPPVVLSGGVALLAAAGAVLLLTAVGPTTKPKETAGMEPATAEVVIVLIDIVVVEVTITLTKTGNRRQPKRWGAPRVQTVKFRNYTDYKGKLPASQHKVYTTKTW